MLKQLFDYVQKLLFLTKEVQQNRSDLEQIRRSVEELTEIVRQQAFEIQRINEREQHEREKLLLKLENALLRVDRLIPPGSKAKRKGPSVSQPILSERSSTVFQITPL